MIVLDTTVLVYAVGSEHRLRDPCRELISAIAAGKLRATTTVEVLQEFTHVRARRRGREDGARLARDYLDVLSPLLIVGEDDLREGLRLYSRGERLGAFDAVLAAAAGRSSAVAIVSADAAFAEADVPHVLPDVPGVTGLLSG